MHDYDGSKIKYFKKGFHNVIGIKKPEILINSGVSGFV